MADGGAPITTPSRPNAGIEQLRDRIGQLNGAFTKRQRTSMLIVAGLIAAIVLGFSFLKPAPNWAPLYTGLSAADAGAITTKLKEQGVRYRLTDGGATVEVDQDAVYQTRADLAELKLPTSGKVGYGILDDQGLTTSEFGQRVGFQRAMEGELASTIEAMDGVQAATVHLALPRDQVFAIDSQQASASVMVKTTGDGLAREQVEAIVNLVASGIQGLTPERVSVTDNKGRLLAAPGRSPSGSGAGSTRESAGSFESSVSGAIESMLAAAVGPGKAKVTVAADLDFDQSTSTKETFEQPGAETGAATPLPLEESQKTETYGAGAPQTAGVLGPTGAPSGNATANNYNLNERQVRNAVNKVTETTNKAPGTVQRMSVAVMVDESAVGPEMITELQNLVSAAAGIDPARGDTVVVSRMAFDQSVEKSLKEGLAKRPGASSSGSMLPLIGAGLAVLIAAVVAFLLLRSRKKDREELELLQLEASEVFGAIGPGSAGSVDLTAQADLLERQFRAPSAPDPQLARRNERREVVSELIDNQPDEVAQLLRSWLGDRRAARR